MARYTDADEKIANIAARQHDAVSRAQAVEAGLSPKALRVRLEQRRLGAGDFRGVFAVAGSAPTNERRIMSAVLAGGPTAFASHSTAAGMFSMPVAVQARPEITVALERHPKIDGVRVHRSGLLVERDVTAVYGIPVAVPERTIVDLSGRLSAHELNRLVDDALRRHITSLGRIVWTVERLRRAPGRSPKRVRQVLDRRLAHGLEFESPLEDFVYDAIRRFGLPLPLCQHDVERDGRRYRLDMCYLDPPIALEIDGFEHHSSRAQFHGDRMRGNDVVLAGFTLLRFTAAFTDWRIAATVAEALGREVPARPSEEVHFAAWHGVWSDLAPTGLDRVKHS